MTNKAWSPTPCGKKLVACLSDFWALSSLLAPVAYCIFCLAGHLSFVEHWAEITARSGSGQWPPTNLRSTDALLSIYLPITLFVFRLSTPGRRFAQVSCFFISVLMLIADIMFIIPYAKDAYSISLIGFSVMAQISLGCWLLTGTVLISAIVDRRPLTFCSKKFWVLNLLPPIVLFAVFFEFSVDLMLFCILGSFFIAFYPALMLSPLVFFLSWSVAKHSLRAEKI